MAYPFTVARGERRTLAIDLPTPAEVPVTPAYAERLAPILQQELQSRGLY